MNERLTIGYVVDDLGFGGVQKQLAILAPAMASRAAIRVYCLSRRIDPYGPQLEAADVAVVAHSRGAAAKLLRVPRLSRAFRADGVDVVHALFDAAGAWSHAAARLAGVPVVLSMQSDRLQLGGWKASVLRRALADADAVVSNSNSGRAFLVGSAGVAPARALTIENWIEPVKPVPMLSGGIVVGFVGRLVELKRIDLLLDAFALVRARRSDARLVIVGDGPDRQRLQACAARLGIEAHVEFTGFTRDVAARMRTFSCLVIPSRYEGLPNVALEAFALGVPVVAFPVGDLGDLVVPGVNGVVVETETAPALAEAVVGAAVDEALQRAARDRGAADAARRFGVERACTELISLYRRIARTQKGR